MRQLAEVVHGAGEFNPTQVHVLNGDFVLLKKQVVAMGVALNIPRLTPSILQLSGRRIMAVAQCSFLITITMDLPLRF